jgi:hypothetical protein
MYDGSRVFAVWRFCIIDSVSSGNKMARTKALTESIQWIHT